MESSLSQVGIRDFDLGIFLTLGAELFTYTVDGTERQGYVIDLKNREDYSGSVVTNIPQLDGKIPVFFSAPEDVFRPFLYPCFVVRSSAFEPAFERCPRYGYRRAPSPGAKKVHVTYKNKTVVGYDSYDYAMRDMPLNIPYDVQVYARNRSNSLILLKWAIRRLRPPFFSVKVYDSHGDKRLYDAGPVSISSMDELTDVSDRSIAYTISFQVRADISIEEIGRKTVKTKEGIIFHYPSLNLNFLDLT